MPSRYGHFCSRWLDRPKTFLFQDHLLFLLPREAWGPWANICGKQRQGLGFPPGAFCGYQCSVLPQQFVIPSCAHPVIEDIPCVLSAKEGVQEGEARGRHWGLSCHHCNHFRAQHSVGLSYAMPLLWILKSMLLFILQRSKMSSRELKQWLWWPRL